MLQHVLANMSMELSTLEMTLNASEETPRSNAKTSAKLSPIVPGGSGAFLGTNVVLRQN